MRDKIQRRLGKAFSGKLSNAISAFRGGRTVVGEYDPVTGTQPKTEFTYTGRGVFGGFSRQIIDQQHILSSDIKLTVLQNELIGADGLPATPHVDDTIDNLRVVDVQQDPAGATWSLQCRGTRIPAVLNDWLLSSGVWTDSGAWSDSDAWNDGDVTNWILLTGLWSDSGEWYDNQEWNDG